MVLVQECWSPAPETTTPTLPFSSSQTLLLFHYNNYLKASVENLPFHLTSQTLNSLLSIKNNTLCPHLHLAKVALSFHHHTPDYYFYFHLFKFLQLTPFILHSSALLNIHSSGSKSRKLYFFLEYLKSISSF